MRSAVDHQPHASTGFAHSVSTGNWEWTIQRKQTNFEVFVCKNGKFHSSHLCFLEGVAARTITVIVPSWRALSFFSPNLPEVLRDLKSFSLANGWVWGRTFYWRNVLQVFRYFMCVCIYIKIHTYKHRHIYTYKYVKTHTHLPRYIYIYIHTYI